MRPFFLCHEAAVVSLGGLLPAGTVAAGFVGGMDMACAVTTLISGRSVSSHHADIYFFKMGLAFWRRRPCSELLDGIEQTMEDHGRCQHWKPVRNDPPDVSTSLQDSGRITLVFVGAGKQHFPAYWLAGVRARSEAGFQIH